jgi:hypothetical protein
MSNQSWSKSRSSLAAFGCPYRFKQIHLEGFDDEGDEARRGSAFHACSYRYISRLARARTPANADLAWEAFNEGLAVSSTPAHLMAEVERLFFNWADDFELNLNAFVAAEERLGYEAAGDLLDGINSQQDLVYAWQDNMIETIDWKTYYAGFSERQAREDFQARQYAWQLWKKYPGFKSYRVTFAFVRLGWSVSVAFEAKELERIERQLRAIVETINRAIAENDFPAKPGDHCGFCRLECPKLDDARRLPARILTPADAERILGETLVLSKALQARLAALSSYTAQSGAVSIAGVTAGHVSHTRASFPVDRVVEILKAAGLQPRISIGRTKLRSYLQTKKHAKVAAQLEPVGVYWNETRFETQRTKADEPPEKGGNDDE